MAKNYFSQPEINFQSEKSLAFSSLLYSVLFCELCSCCSTASIDNWLWFRCLAWSWRFYLPGNWRLLSQYSSHTFWLQLWSRLNSNFLAYMVSVTFKMTGVEPHWSTINIGFDWLFGTFAAREEDVKLIWKKQKFGLEDNDTQVFSK